MAKISNKQVTRNIKRLDTKLKSQEEVFKVLFENSSIAFYWLDKNGYFRGANDLELKIHGISSLSDLIGKHSSEIGTLSAWKTLKE